MARNDFWAAFLRGMYEGGVGNPQVNEERRRNDLNQQYIQANLDMAAREKGMIPSNAPGGTDPNAPGPDGGLHPDHPMTSKIGSFVKGLLFPGSTGPSLNTAYKPDPNAPSYYLTPQGEAGFTTGGKPIPEGAVKISGEKGPALVTSTEKGKRGNLDFESARAMAKLAGVPTAMDTLISSAMKQGRDYVSKDEVGTTLRAMNTKAGLERGEYFKKMINVHQGRLELAQNQATFGGQFGKNQLSLNTALGHVATVSDAYNEIGNLDVAFLNTPINEIKRQTNDPSIVKLDTALTALSDELATTFKGSSGTDIQMQEWSKTLNDKLTPDQAKAAINQIGELLDSRLTNLEFQQGLVSGGRVKPGSALSPKSKKVIEKLNNSQTTKDGWGIKKL